MCLGGILSRRISGREMSDRKPRSSGLLAVFIAAQEWPARVDGPVTPRRLSTAAEAQIQPRPLTLTPMAG